MKLVKANFQFSDKELGEITVCWFEENHVEVSVKGKRHVIDNPKGQYKPCVTHCRDLVRLVTFQPPATEFARQREKRVREQKPKLKIVGSK